MKNEPVCQNCGRPSCELIDCGDYGDRCPHCAETLRDHERETEMRGESREERMGAPQ